MASWLSKILSAANIRSSKKAVEVRTDEPGLAGIVAVGAVDVRFSRGTSLSVSIGADFEEDLKFFDVSMKERDLHVKMRHQDRRSGAVPASVKRSVFGVVIQDTDGAESTQDLVVGNGLPVGSPRGAVWVDVVGPSVERVEVVGCGSVTVRNIEQQEISVSVSGAGEIEVSGRVRDVKGSIQGSGDIDLGLLSAQTGSFIVAGSGEIEAFAAKMATARIQGSGDITIHGNPLARDVNVNGSGEICFA